MESQGRGGLRLVGLSFLMLFVELALIRWTGSNILYLSYFSNLVLLASFLGIGIGFLTAGSRRTLFPLAPLALAALVAFVRLFPVEIDRSGSELIFFGEMGKPSGLPLWLTLPVLFTGVALVMMLIGQGVARTFREFPPLEAYRLDITGSLLGIISFSLLSFLGAPPFVWGVVVTALLLFLIGRRRWLTTAAPAALMLLFLAIESLTPGVSWSPYYKISLTKWPSGETRVLVNGIPHQTIEAGSVRLRNIPLYGLPYQYLKQTPKDVLVVGAGTGDDVAIALARGARHVDAVEIDPRLHRLGVQMHPDHPYQDPRVTAIINDGRAFLETTNHRYDLILFALPDSLTLVSGQASLRLESYLFTVEAMQAARAHLNPGGAFGEYNYYRESWLVDRLAGTLRQVYGQPPCLNDTGQPGAHLALLMSSVQPGAISCPTRWHPVAGAPAPATDDYPFLYLRDRTIPSYYLLTLGLILALALIMVRGSRQPIRPMATYLDLFCMGAAFLLLETRSVVQFALLFGTTWLVNALVFTGILVAVYLAIEVARRFPLPPPMPLYAALLVGLLVAWLTPLHQLLALPFLPRFLVATTLAFIPVFLANLVFAQRFKAVAGSSLAFGANLLGAMLGGVLEYTSLVTGYRALLVLVALLYGAAFALQARYRVAVALRARRPAAVTIG